MNSKPVDAAERHAAKLRQQEILVAMGAWRSCLGCDYFRKENSMCALFNMPPPPEIIVHGCKDYLENIPF